MGIGHLFQIRPPDTYWTGGMITGFVCRSKTSLASTSNAEASPHSMFTIPDIPAQRLRLDAPPGGVRSRFVRVTAV